MTVKVPRYFVTPPVRDGFAWFTVADTQSKEMPNFTVAMFAESCPGAEREALALCAKLNGLKN